MERVDQIVARRLIRKASGVGLVTILATGLISAVSSVVHAQEVKVPQDPPAYVPQIVLRVKDGKYLSSITEKNEWFKEFRQTPFYQGLVGRIAPVIFAPADDHGSARAAWQGRLIEYLYSKLMQNRPVSLHFYRRRDLSSPFVVSVHDLSKSEMKIATGLISALSSGKSQDYKFRDAGAVKVTAIVVKQQKFAVVVGDSCISIGRAPDAVASSAYACSKSAPMTFDAEADFSLSESFPALRGLSEKFVGVLPRVKMQLKWESTKSRFAVQAAKVELADHLLGKGKMPPELMSAIPAESLFFASGLIPNPKDGFSPDGLAKYFKQAKPELRKGASFAVALAYVPVYEANSTTHSTVVLLHVPKNKESTVTQLTQSFSTRKPETFVRSVCGELVALSSEAKTFDTIESVCKKQRPAFSQMSKRWIESAQANNLSGLAYLSPGKLFSMQIERGWKKTSSKATVPFAAEIKQARTMVEMLPAYFFAGGADDKQMSMKAME
ncbi:MAG: hypothetical protein JNJ49_07135 [Bdellovibrionaceae bacterium]|nr:hypothetical protein [Pseudobdellovibrionaceae bacterium]